MKDKRYTSSTIKILCLSFFLSGCQTKNFDYFNTQKYAHNFKEISSDNSFYKISSKPPKYNQFTSKKRTKKY